MVKILFAIKMWPWQQSLGRSLPTTVSTHSMPTPPPPPARLCPTTISIHWGTLSSGTSNCTTPTTSRRSCSGTSFSPRQRTYDDDELLNVELYGDAEASDEDRDIRRAMAAGSLIVPRIDDVTPAVLMSDESRGGLRRGNRGAQEGKVRRVVGRRHQLRHLHEELQEGQEAPRPAVPARPYRFHGKCLRKWLARSHVCPLCRHALPTVDDATD
jgi:hypothetical protein